MSIQINWDSLTGGPEGDALAESIRAFIHDRFQQVALPKLIKSVKVHAFEFGKTPPEVALKDVCDPLPDFYGDDDDDMPPSTGPVSPEVQQTVPHPAEHGNGRSSTPHASTAEGTSRQSDAAAASSSDHLRGRTTTKPTLTTNFAERGAPAPLLRSTLTSPHPLLPRATTPAIPGGTSNMSYFHLPFSNSLSGAVTPLAAVAGGHFGAWPGPGPGSGQHELHPFPHHPHPHDDPTSPDFRRDSYTHVDGAMSDANASNHETDPTSPPEKSIEDVQIVLRLKYSGDVKLSLTAEILLDYPMPSFVGIPVKLNVTGLTFDGVAVLAYMRQSGKACFCFLAPEDAEVVVGGDGDGGGGQREEGEGASSGGVGDRGKGVVGGLFEEIRVESEIGQKTAGKQVLKNVGRVEKFVLEQVRRIFENEFVYPSFWTFLV